MTASSVWHKHTQTENLLAKPVLWPEKLLKVLFFRMVLKSYCMVVIRYYVFCYANSYGIDCALNELETFNKLKGVAGLTSQEKGFIYIGVKRELEFFKRYQHALHLVPTLDAGCAFDVVGQVKSHFVCMDVTQNIEHKKEKDVAQNMKVPLGWHKRFAEVKNDSIQFFDEYYKECRKNRTLRTMTSTRKVSLQKQFKPDINFFLSRHVWLNYLEIGKPISLAMEGLISTKGISRYQLELLIAHLRFYAYYRDVLKLVPTLSCGDCTDFVGEISGEMIHYFVLTDTKDYHKNYSKYLEARHKAGDRYEVAVYSMFDQTFQIFKFNEYHNIEPNFDIPKEDET